MQRLFSKLLFQSQSKRSFKSPSLFGGPFDARFSTIPIPNRPMRGERNRDRDRDCDRRRRNDDHDGSSEDYVIRNLNFGDGADQEIAQRRNRGGGGRERRGGFYESSFSGGRGSQGLTRDLQILTEGEISDQKIHHNDPSLRENERGQSQSGKNSLSNEFNFEEMGSEKNTSKEEEPLPKDANEIFQKMKETGLIPNAVAMLDGLCKEGQFQEAIKLFGLMREKKTMPEVVVYTAVVEGFCKASKFDDAKRIFRKMQKNGIAPNSWSYLIVIQGLCRGKKLEDAAEFCLEMLDAGLHPNVATLVMLVNLFVGERSTEEGEEFLRNLRKRGFLIDEKAVRDHLHKTSPHPPMVWEVILGKKTSQRPN